MQFKDFRTIPTQCNEFKTIKLTIKLIRYT